MPRFRRSLTATVIAVAASCLLSATAGAAVSVVGHLYVNDNTAGTNTIAGFDRNSDGSLAPLPGSPFSAGGAGTGSTVGSQGSLQVSANGHYLLAVDPGSNQISVLRIHRDGSLALVPDGVVSSDGVEPVSIAVHNGLVYVANAGNGGSNYTGFRLRRGRLVAIPDSSFALPDGSSPGDVVINSDGTNLIGTRVTPSLIDSFSVGRDGRLTSAGSSPLPAQGAGPFGSEFSPTNPQQLFVSNAHAGANNGTVSAFSVAGDGTLSSIGASPFADFQTAPCWVEISHDGRFLFAVNTASSSISSYRVAPDGTLELLGSTALRNGSGLAPFDARLSPDGRTMWVVDHGADGVSGLAVEGGRLRELSSSPTALPTGASPFGIVVN